jgi:hypothetical protein
VLTTAAIANAVRRGLLSFTDLFNRANSPSLGSPWRVLGSGQFGIASNRATSTTAAASYPIAVIDTRNVNMSVSASVTPGTGVAFWVTDSGNWWSVASYQESVTSTFTFSCNCSTFYFSCNCRYVVSGCDCYQSPEFTCVAYGSCCTLNCPPGYGSQFFNSDACGEYCESCCTQYSMYYVTVCRQVCGSEVCDTCSGQSCATCTGTTTTVTNFLRILRSLAATVTVAATAQASAAIAAVKAVVSGSSVSATAYSDTAKTQSVATATASLDQPAKRAGILITPSSSGQGNSVDDFVLEQV